MPSNLRASFCFPIDEEKSPLNEKKILLKYQSLASFKHFLKEKENLTAVPSLSRSRAVHKPLSLLFPCYHAPSLLILSFRESV